VDQRTAPGAGEERGSGEPERPSPSDIRELKKPTHVDLQQGVNAYLPLVLRVVRQLARRLPANVQRDDLIAAGICGLVDSLRRNGGDGGAAFAWYARTRIRGAIFDELRAQDWLSRRARAATTPETTASFVSFEDVAASDEEVRLGLAGCVDPSEAIEARSQQRALARALERLPERERTVVARYYFEGKRLKDIGAELGVSEPRISQLLARALERLRDLLLHEAA
jgi:RNA polymerase sigma factor for flagellar operon FliA